MLLQEEKVNLLDLHQLTVLMDSGHKADFNKWLWHCWIETMYHNTLPQQTTCITVSQYYHNKHMHIMNPSNTADNHTPIHTQIESGGERETQTETDRNSQTQTERDRHMQANTQACTHIGIHTKTQMSIMIDSHTLTQCRQIWTS